MITKRDGSAPEKALVTFQLPAKIWADSVCLVGDFNDWDMRGIPMHMDAGDTWQVTLELDRGKSYEYRYLLDGQNWCNDSNADRSVPNPYGGQNSVVDT
jgi:1,4-alpha-glucan branching enzyme